MGISGADGAFSETILPIVDTYSSTVDVSADHTTTNLPYVKDTFINKTSINMDRYPEIVATLLGYGEGSAIKVTYFHNNDSKIGTKTTSSDLLTRLDNVHLGYLQVNDFEFKLRHSLEFTYNPDDGHATCQGEGYVYPGFNPQPGDQFLYKTDTAQMGLFKLNRVERLSIKKSTYHSISFELVSFVDQLEIDAMQAVVDQVVYFDKQRYLVSEGTLLYSEDYLLIKEINKLHDILVSLFCKKFYDKAYHTTFIRPDGKYDPYINSFLLDLIGYEQLQSYPSTLLADPIGEDLTIFALLKNPNEVNRTKLLPKQFTKIYTTNLRSTVINSLINKEYIEVVGSDTGDDIIDSESTYYVLSENFYNMNIESYSVLERLVTTYLESNEIHPVILLTLVRDYKLLSEEQFFYRVPIYLFLLNKLNASIGQ